MNTQKKILPGNLVENPLIRNLALKLSTTVTFNKNDEIANLCKNIISIHQFNPDDKEKILSFIEEPNYYEVEIGRDSPLYKKCNLVAECIASIEESIYDIFNVLNDTLDTSVTVGGESRGLDITSGVLKTIFDQTGFDISDFMDEINNESNSGKKALNLIDLLEKIDHPFEIPPKEVEIEHSELFSDLNYTLMGLFMEGRKDWDHYPQLFIKIGENYVGIIDYLIDKMFSNEKLYVGIMSLIAKGEPVQDKILEGIKELEETDNFPWSYYIIILLGLIIEFETNMSHTDVTALRNFKSKTLNNML